MATADPSTVSSAAASTNLDADLLRELLDYNPDTGVFVWKERSVRHFSSERAANSWNRRFAGKLALRGNGEGYFRFRIMGRDYLAHRLAWLYMTGEWPSDYIDHIDRDKGNNAWANLRNVTHAQNCQNLNVRSHPKTSKYRGVIWHKVNKKWASRITVNQKLIWLGAFDDEYPAALMSAVARALMHTHAGNP